VDDDDDDDGDDDGDGDGDDDDDDDHGCTSEGKKRVHKRVKLGVYKRVLALDTNHLNRSKYSNGKWPFLVDFPMKNGDFPLLIVMFTRGYDSHTILIVITNFTNWGPFLYR